MNEQQRIADILGEWHEKRDRGEFVHPEDLYRAHPDLADALREQFVAQALLEQALSESPDETPGAQIPDQIGDFRIVRELGRGGMGVVYEAVQASLDRRVALKVLSVSFTSAPQAVKRFQREAKAAARLHHTNIVPVHDLDHHAGQWFYVMELVDGRTLSSVLRELRAQLAGPTETRFGRAVLGQSQQTVDPLTQTRTGTRAYFHRVAEMFAEVADALHSAHAEGVIHRDIKPSNLMLDADGRLKIVDFGLARLDDDVMSMTVTGDLLGTPAYMSPEQAMAKRAPVDHRTDIYSLGATLYETLTLSAPFAGRSLPELCSQIIAKDPKPPTGIDSRIPRDIETVVCKAMEKDRDRRYQSAGEFARDLRRYAEGFAVHARRVGSLERAWRKVRRNKVRSSLVVGVLILAAATSVLMVQWVRAARREKEAEYFELCAAGWRADFRVRPGLADIEARTAADYFAQAIEILPDLPDAYVGRALTETRRPQDKLDDVEAARARGLSRHSYHLLRSDVFRLMRRWEDMKAEQALLGSDPAGGPLDHLVAGTLEAHAGRHAEAAASLGKAIDASPEAGPIVFLLHRSRGIERARLGDLDGALEDFVVARKLGDKTLETHVRLAWIWRRLGREARAERTLTDILERLRAQDGENPWLGLMSDSGLGSIPAYDWWERVSLDAVRAHPESARVAVARARAHGALRQHGKAFAEAERALTLDPSSQSARFLRARALLGLHRDDEAIQELGALCGLAPQDDRIRAEFARALRVSGQRQRALEVCDEGIRANPYSWIVHLSRSQVLQSMGRLEDALASVDRAVELAPGLGVNRGARSLILLDRGHAGEAREAADRALEIDPTNYEALFCRGQLHDAAGEYDKAALDFERLVKTEPDVNGYYNLVAAYLKAGQADRAVKASERAVQLFPHEAAAYLARGSAQLSLGNHAEALAAVDDAEKAGHQSVRSHRVRGHLLVQLKRFEQAADVFVRLAELEPNDIDVLSYAGGLLTNVGRPEEGLRMLDRALELDDSVAVVHLNRSITLDKLGQVEEALEAIERAVYGLNYRTPMALAQMARTSGKRALELLDSPGRDADDLEESVELARRASELGPAPWIWHIYGVASLRAGKWADALAAFERAQQGQAPDAQGLFLIAMARHKLGRQDARAAFDKAVACMGQHKSEDEALNRLRAEAEEVLGIAKK